MHAIFLPEPAYSGPDLVMYFRGSDNLEVGVYNIVYAIGIIYRIYTFTSCTINTIHRKQWSYGRSDTIHFLRLPATLQCFSHCSQGELDQKNVTWIIEFYAAWLPSCVNFASIFAQISAKFIIFYPRSSVYFINRYEI